MKLKFAKLMVVENFHHSSVIM